jgi:hypothetical protein
MLRLRVVQGDLLASEAAAIMLPFDGELPAHAGAAQVERSLGRIARAFARRFPACELVEEIEAQVELPVPLGGAAHVELGEGSPFRAALLLSCHAHQGGQTHEQALRTAASAALARALELCDGLALGSVAAPLLKGGWRLSSSAAATLMLRTLASARLRHPLEVEIRVLDEPDAATTLRDLARSLGL